MKHAKNRSIRLLILAILVILTLPATAPALITATGDVDPEDPNTWDSDTTAYIGKTDTTDPGEVEVNGGSDLLSDYAYLGYDSGTSGMMTINGTGSTWTCDNDLEIGRYGNGTLNILNDASVSNINGYVGHYPNSAGEVTINGADSTWTNSNDLFIGHEGSGILTITNAGTVNSYISTIGNKTGSAGTVTVDGVGSTWTSGCLKIGGGYMLLSSNGNGTLEIINGGTVNSEDSNIGNYADSTGTVTVDGNDSAWITSGRLYIGCSGNGTLEITNGGMVNCSHGEIGQSSGSMGEVTVNGPDSTWTNLTSLMVGGMGNGTLTVTNGGSVSNTGGTIGFFVDSTGTVTVTGTNSTWTNKEALSVGDYGNGILNITNGGSVSNTLGAIAYGYGSTGIVTVENNSTWTNSGSLYVGSCDYSANCNSKGTLIVKNNSTVSSTYGYLGRYSGSIGEVTVDGTGSTWTTRFNIHVGGLGEGKLVITNGGTVSNASGYIGRDSDLISMVTVDGNNSKWTNSDILHVGYHGSGTLTITNGGTVNSGYGYIGNQSGSTGVVTIDGTGSTWTNSGRYFYVGNNGSGTLTITNGGLVSIAKTLTIDDNDDGDSFINMSSGGMLALFGDADDSLGDFLGLVDGTDAIRYWDDAIGAWALLTGATAGEDYRLSYIESGELAGYTLLTVMGMPGDANGDGQVDGSDATILASYWQTGVGNPDLVNVTWSMGDFNRDGQVDGSDATILANYWQAGVEPTGTSVPEPSMLFLLATVLGGLLVWARQGKP